MLRTVLSACFGVVVLALLSGAEPQKRDHDITVDDYFSQATIMASVMSPQGDKVAYLDARWQQSTDDRKSDLWVVDTKTKKSTRLTFDRASYSRPQWGNDHLYVMAKKPLAKDKKEETQVWRIALGTGDMTPVTQVDGGISHYGLTADAKRLFYTTSAEEVDKDWKAFKQQYKSIEYGHGVHKVHEVWSLDLTTWRAEKILDDKRHIHDLAVAPNGGRIAMFTTHDGTVVQSEGRSRVDILDVESRKVTPLPDKGFRADAPSPYGWLEGLAWAADSNALAFNIVFDGYPAEIHVATWSEGKVAMQKIQRPEGVHVKGYGSPLAWRGKGRTLCYLGEQKARLRALAVADVGAGKQGQTRVLTPGDVVVEQLSFSANGESGALLVATPTALSDLYLLSKDDKLTRLTDVNPQTASWKLPKLQVVSWKGANGDAVEGILELPADYKEGTKIPLVVEIHGGPTTSTLFGQQYWIYGRTLLPAKGYAVLSPNYRGSTGYGDKFLTDLVGKENDVDVQDILSGVDAMVEKGIADPEKLGVMGWSNGGYLTNCIIAKTPRFKAASSGASILDTITEWGTNDEPAYAIVFKKGLPWTNPESYHRTSPTYQLDKVKTPTLIHVGANDERCPPGHSRMLHRALKEYVKVPTELLMYPGEPHGLTKYKSRKAKMEWDLAWFDRYIRGNKAGE